MLISSLLDFNVLCSQVLFWQILMALGGINVTVEKLTFRNSLISQLSSINGQIWAKIIQCNSDRILLRVNGLLKKTQQNNLGIKNLKVNIWI